MLIFTGFNSKPISYSLLRFFSSSGLIYRWKNWNLPVLGIKSKYFLITDIILCMVERDPKSELRKMILSEIEEWKSNETGGFSWHIKLSNFHSYLPADEYPENGGRLIGYMVQAAGLMDVVNKNSHKGELEEKYRSKLFLNQTPREFFRVIDETIEEVPEVTLEEIKRLQTKHYSKLHGICLSRDMSFEEEKRQKKKIKESAKALKALYEYALPLYVELRVKGYSQFDLTV